MPNNTDDIKKVDHHEAIYQLADDRNSTGLIAYSKAHLEFIDAPRKGTIYLSAAARLARENNWDMVKILLMSGARLDLIAYDAAFSGYTDHMTDLKASHSQRCKNEKRYIQLLMDELSKHVSYSYEFKADNAAVSDKEQGKFYAFIKTEGIILPNGDLDTSNTLGAALNYGIELIKYNRMNWSDLNAIIFKVQKQIDQDFLNLCALGAAQSGNTSYAEELRLQGADVKWLVKGAAMGGDNDYMDKISHLYKAQTFKTVIQACIAKEFTKAEQVHNEYKTSIEDIVSHAEKSGNNDNVDILRSKLTLFESLPSSSNPDEFQKAIDDKIISLALEGTQSYRALPAKTHLGFWSKNFDSHRGKNRAEFYQKVLDRNNERSIQDKLIFLYALLASDDGKTLKQEVSKALLCETPEQARALVQNLLLEKLLQECNGNKDKENKAIEQLNNRVARIVEHANSLSKKNSPTNCPENLLIDGHQASSEDKKWTCCLPFKLI